MTSGAKLEERLRRLGADFDALADRYESDSLAREPHLVLPERVAAHPRRRKTLVVVAALVTVVVVLVALALERNRSDAPANSPPQWERLDSRTAGIRHAGAAGVAGTVGERFVALGSGVGWTSDDGRHWHRVSIPQSDGVAINGVAHANGIAVIWSPTFATGRPRMWSSRDGRHWRPLDLVGLAAAAGSLNVVGREAKFVATGSVVNPDGSLAAAAWTSTDATHWQRSVVEGNPPLGFGPAVWLDGRLLALGPQQAMWASDDGATWTKIADTTPARLGTLYVPPNGKRVYGIQYETANGSPGQGGSFGGRLMTSRDGITWTEITSFHEQFPVANPGNLLRTHGWWVLGGNTGTPSGKRRCNIWMSKDLKQWTELPRRLQGKPTSGTDAVTAANRDVVVATALYYDHAIWIWEP